METTNARLRRLASDWEEIKKNFNGHRNIAVTPIGDLPPEKYHVTYFVNGIYLLPDGRIETLGRHEVEITAHAEYPRYKPICKILTPIWHPNFRDGQICIGDIWGAGESITDIIINIGDMIQYKSWNSYSPLSAEAAKWAIENKHLFPVGDINLHIADYASAKDDVHIDLFDENEDNGEIVPETTSETKTIPAMAASSNSEPVVKTIDFTKAADQNDFEISGEELEGIEFVPSSQRMQGTAHGGMVKGKRINFKTVFMKGILWGLIGGVLGFVLQEAMSGVIDYDNILGWFGYHDYTDLLYLTDEELYSILTNVIRLYTAFFAAFIACGLGLFMGVGEGVYYGSKENTLKYGLMGIGISLVLGFVSGYIAQIFYSALLSNTASLFTQAFVRGFGWAIMGAGVGLAVGLIKPEKKRILYCVLGGLAGGFVGGFLFDFIATGLNTGQDDTGIVPRAIGIIIMGVLIGLGIGLLEQFAKQAWLKVIRGDFEGKEYLVFSGTTTIGNNGRNTIVLFKDKLVAPHHCDIVLEGRKYVLIDAGSPLGTVVNGMKVDRHVLKQGDAIAVGNSVLVFNTK